MKTDNFNHAKRYWCWERDNAAVLDALVPAVIERQGTVSVIVSPAAWDEAGQLRSANHQALTPEPPSSPSTSPVAPWRRWPISFADSPP